MSSMGSARMVAMRHQALMGTPTLSCAKHRNSGPCDEVVCVLVYVFACGGIHRNQHIAARIPPNMGHSVPRSPVGSTLRPNQHALSP
jgi:hypothetical protein